MPPRALAPLLVPLSWLYRAAAAAHRWTYRSGLRRAGRLRRPVASVGNLLVGGGGKSPLVAHLARRLAESGVNVAVLSRGYGRRDRRSTRIVSRGQGPLLDALLAGDEPVLIARKAPDAWVAVSPSRREAGLAVLAEGDVDLFLLDDGFQHHALERDLDIVAVDGFRRFGNHRLLPAGPLREPLARLSDADVVVVTKAREVDARFEAEMAHLTAAPVCWASFRPRALAGLEGGTSPTDLLGERKVFLFSGIADPASFEETASPLCGEVAGSRRFPDHHPFKAGEVEELEHQARNKGAEVLLTTEKDLLRVPPGLPRALPLYALSMEIVFLRGEEALVSRLMELTEGGR